MRSERGETVIEPCTFTAVVGPIGTATDMIAAGSALRRYLFLFVSGNFSRILTHVDRNSANFDVRRAFTAHQLLTILREAAHTVVFIEHDPTLFDGTWDMIAPLAGALDEISREATVILYSPSADRSFSLLARNARHVICYLPEEPAVRWRTGTQKTRGRPGRQETLGA